MLFSRIYTCCGLDDIGPWLKQLCSLHKQQYCLCTEQHRLTHADSRTCRDSYPDGNFFLSAQSNFAPCKFEYEAQDVCHSNQDGFCFSTHGATSQSCWHMTMVALCSDSSSRAITRFACCILASMLCMLRLELAPGMSQRWQQRRKLA